MKEDLKIHRKCNQIVLIVLIYIISLYGCASYNYADISKNIRDAYPGQPEGYLKTTDLPDSKGLLPPPPQPGSAALENDREVSVKYLYSGDSLRWKQAKIDANLNFPSSIDAFTGILHQNISVKTAPYLYLLLQRVLADASTSTSSAKVYYKRQRPFLLNNLSTCDPQEEPYLRTSGSYPSGHTAIGWSWALIMTELFPDKTNIILQRGLEFGESRLVCNVHWYSDVVEGRIIGAATVAALHGNIEFQHDLKKAKKEIRKIYRHTSE
jgi:acid phosphatase (class A)